MCFLPTGGTFGSTTSPSEYEPFAQARAYLAEYLSRDESLVEKHKDILDLVDFVEDDNPDPSVFVQAIADKINNGVFDKVLGRDVNTPHNPFVDDTLMAEIRRHILTCMAARVEALVLIMGQLSESERRSPLSMDKYSVFPCSWEKVQLGIHMNT